VITFRQNPKRILSPEKYQGDIFSLRQKLEVLESLGVSRTLLIDFSEKFSKITGREFIDILRKNCRIGYMALGVNFRCGRGLDTGARAIRDMMAGEGPVTDPAAPAGPANPVDLVDPVEEGGRPVSSSRIRELISSGDLALAAVLLGRKVRIDLADIPAAGSGEGRFYDTASAFRVTPPPGAYKVLVYGGDSETGIAAEISIGKGGIFLPGKTGGLSPEVKSIEFID
jgi:riboflavin kinase/FMN adenylyltransferase